MRILIEILGLSIELNITFKRPIKRSIPIGDLGTNLRKYQEMVKGVNNASNH